MNKILLMRTCFATLFSGEFEEDDEVINRNITTQDIINLTGIKNKIYVKKFSNYYHVKKNYISLRFNGGQLNITIMYSTGMAPFPQPATIYYRSEYEFGKINSFIDYFDDTDGIMVDLENSEWKWE